jgi:YD repeat-containing protein
MGNMRFKSSQCLLLSLRKSRLVGNLLRKSLCLHWPGRSRRCLLETLLLAALTLTAARGDALDSQDNSVDRASDVNPPRLSERDLNRLRGPVKTYIDETTYPPQALADGKQAPEMKTWARTEYDFEGHVVVRGSRNPGGPEWVTRYAYDPSGRLLRETRGMEGEPAAEILYHYDDQGRQQSIANSQKPENPITFRYDENGRKTKLQISGPEDYRPNLSTAGYFESADRAPNLPGGGSATTIYDAYDRPVEVQTRDAKGELLSRTVRTFDNYGNVVEEKQTMDDVMKMIPAETQTEFLAGSNASLDDFRDQLTKFLGGRGEIWSVAYSYDAQGRVAQTTQRVLNHSENTVQSTYNDHGELALEITHTLIHSGDGKAPEARDSEARYSYEYDDHGNWTEKKVTYRSMPDGAFRSSTQTTRTLEYF